MNRREDRYDLAEDGINFLAVHSHVVNALTTPISSGQGKLAWCCASKSLNAFWPDSYFCQVERAVDRLRRLLKAASVAVACADGGRHRAFEEVSCWSMNLLELEYFARPLGGVALSAVAAHKDCESQC